MALRRRRRAALVGFLALLVMGSCSSSDRAGSDAAPPSTDTPPPTTAGPLPFTPDPIVWQACTPDHDCATLTVPVDWAHPEGPTTDVAMIRVPARHPARRIGSLLVNPGGPGASGIDAVSDSGYPTAANNRFDIIGWDPRGVGQSSPLGCGDAVPAYLRADPSPDGAAEAAALDDAARAVGAECERTDGDVLRFLGAQSEAHDLEATRIALGEARLNFLGYSAGTTIGARYAALYPTHVRAMVLDGVVDPTSDHEAEYLLQARGYELGLDEIFASCDDDPSCPLDDPAAAFDEVAAAVERDRLPGGDAGLGPAEFGRASFFATYTDALWAAYLEGLDAAQQGDGDRLADLAAVYDTTSTYTAYAAIWCVDEPHPVGAAAWDASVDRILEVAPRLGAVEANEMRPCAFWPAEPTRPLDPVVAPGSPPILVVGNTNDHVTPIEGAQAVAATLDDGHLLTVQASQHTSGGIPCADAAVAHYLVTVEPPDQDC